ncbi:MAG: deoxyribodipyrimidine photo-lyase [Bacteroidales bacterium]|nr:deoxyribodipyrimidine photo-lyase [Bacteroidales bacterium]
MKTAIFWFRRDLRLDDNVGLFQAMNSGLRVLPIFVFDSEILDELPKNDARVDFIFKEISYLKKSLEEMGSSLLILKGKPIEQIPAIVKKYNVAKIFVNSDYEPYAIERDSKIGKFCNENGIDFLTHKDQVVFEKDEILSKSGNPYTVFTPYSKSWKEKLKTISIEAKEIDKLSGNFIKTRPFPNTTLEQLGFSPSAIEFLNKEIDLDKIRNYHINRDLPSVAGTSRLSVHLRFGTVSIRKLVKIALENNEKWLNELIWREFYMQILWHFPNIVKNSFRKKYDRMVWRNNSAEFEAWKNGKTGYPIVDAGMREMNETGFMHNRLRMITASFLTKHLLIDWRWGEAYFAEKLLDYELSSNNGGWQWAAGTGCDAVPYFRIFNPSLQQKRFDPNLLYIKKWIPEIDTDTYPKPIVNHELARKRTLEAYKKIQ